MPIILENLDSLVISPFLNSCLISSMKAAIENFPVARTFSIENNCFRCSHQECDSLNVPKTANGIKSSQSSTSCSFLTTGLIYFIMVPTQRFTLGKVVCLERSSVFWSLLHIVHSRMYAKSFNEIGLSPFSTSYFCVTTGFISVIKGLMGSLKHMEAALLKIVYFDFSIHFLLVRKLIKCC